MALKEITKKGRIEMGLVVALLVIVLMVMLGIMAVAAHNEANSITEGTVVDKTYHKAYVETGYSQNGNTVTPQVIYHPEEYLLRIEGYNKNDKQVKYWFECTAEEYRLYRIGDYYRK